MKMDGDKMISITKNLMNLRNLKLEFDDNTLLDCATRIYNSEVMNDLRYPFQTGKETNKDKPTLKPTDKQLKLLYKANADFNAETITRSQASKLIDKIIKEKKEKRKE